MLMSVSNEAEGAVAGWHQTEHGSAFSRRPGVQSMGKTSIHRAKARFLDEVLLIPGVLRVVAHGGEVVAERALTVFVPNLRCEAGQAVFELQGRILRDFPGARLDVEVDGLEELGLTLETLAEWVPEGATVLEPRPNVPLRPLTAAS
jgi:hypothetical protein